MMTVRFPNGFSVQYNDARYASRMDTYTDLYDKKGGRWIAQVPNDALIEVERSCRVYNAVNEPSDALQAVLKLVRERSDRLDGYSLRDLKRALMGFDAVRRKWK